MRLFWWLYCLLFVVAGILKSNDTYLFIGGLFAIAAAIGELGWKLRKVLDKLNAIVYGDDIEE